MDKKLEARIARLEKLLMNEDVDKAAIAKLARSLDRYVDRASKFIDYVDNLVIMEDDDAPSKIGMLWNAEVTKCYNIHRALLSLVRRMK